MPLPGVASGATKQCTAHNKKTGERCKNPAVDGFNVCRYHGANGRGIANANYKNGRYSKGIPARLIERYEASEKDPDLLALRSEIALIDSRIADVLTRVDTGESERMWTALKDEVQALKEALALGQTINFRRIDALINNARNDWMSWNEIIIMIENRRKMVLAEAKRLETMQQMITAGQATTLMQAMLESVQRNVSDPKEKAAVQADFVRLATFTE